MTASGAFYTVGAVVSYVELRRRLYLPSIPALFVKRNLRWFGHTARCPGDELIKDLRPHTPPHDAGNHNQGRPGTHLRTASLRPRPMKKRLNESIS